MGNEFDINVGLKKRRKRNLDENINNTSNNNGIGAERIFQTILQAISDLKISKDEIHFKKTNPEEKLEKDLTSEESEFKSNSLKSNSLDSKIFPEQKWFYAEKFKNPNEESNFN